MVRTSIHAQLAEHAGTEVVFILHQYFLLLSGFFVQHAFAGDVDTVVRTSHLAQTTCDALVVTFCIGRHGQASTETWGNFQRVTVFRILFGHFLRKEFTTGDFHPCQ